MKETTRTTIALTLAALIVVASILLVTTIVMQLNQEQEPEPCVIKGSVKHRVMYISDLPLAMEIIKSGNKLGPYFDYNFCKEEK